MNRLIISLVASSGWIAFFYSNQDFLISKISALPIYTFPNSQTRELDRNLGIENISFPNQISFDLYSSISEGMFYEEVRNIIGWDGVLIYENEIEYAGGTINEKIYQWNNEDIYSLNYDSDLVGDLNPYWTVTLQFQNDLLVGKTFSNLQP